MIVTSLMWIALNSNTAVESPMVGPVAPPLQDEAEGAKWSGSFRLGASYSSGNTNRQSLSAAFDAERRSDQDRTSVKAWWNTALENSQTATRTRTEENLGAEAKYDYFVNEQLYYNGLAGFNIDRQANLDLRYYIGAGAGYQFIEEEDQKFAGELGLVYFNEEFSNGTDSDSIALRAAYSYYDQLTETTLFEQDFAIFPAVDDFDDYYLTLDSRIKVNMTESMFAQAQHVLDYDNTPAAGTGKNDNLVIVGIGWSF